MTTIVDESSGYKVARMMFGLADYNVNRGRTSESQRLQLLYWVVYEGQRTNECFQLIDGKPSLYTACSTIFTLRAKLSGAVYCNRSCLFVGLLLCLFVCLFVGLLLR